MLDVSKPYYIKINTTFSWLSYITNVDLYYEALDWDSDDEIEHFFNSEHELIWDIAHIPDKPKAEPFHLLFRVLSYEYALAFLDTISIQEDVVDSMRKVSEKHKLKILDIQRITSSLLTTTEFRNRFYHCVYKQHVIVPTISYSPTVCILKIPNILNQTTEEELLFDVEVCRI